MKKDIRTPLTLLLNGHINIEQCEQRIAEMHQQQTNNTYANDVFAAIEQVTNITAAQLKSRDRSSTIVNARKIYAYLMREAGHNLTDTGKLIDRNHSNVINLVNKYNQHYKNEPSFQKTSILIHKLLWR